jgi:hypothetical protein
VSDSHSEWLGETETAKSLKKPPKAPKSSEILISARKKYFSKNVRGDSRPLRAIDVAGLQGSFPMPYDRPEWSRSTPQHFREKYFFGLKSRFSSIFGAF